MDLGELVFLVWALFFFPILLGMAATLFAAYCGAESKAHLPIFRHLLATAFGGVIGCGCFSAVLVVAYFTVDGLAEILGSIFAASLVGALIAYHTAKYVSTKVIWYQCEKCGMKYRLGNRQECPFCAPAANEDLPKQGDKSYGSYTELSHNVRN